MNKKTISMVNIFYIKECEKILLGRLLLKDRKIFFEYHSEFLKTGLELSPFKLPLKAGVSVSDTALFDGLFGVFNDSLPDGWGRLLLDRKLAKLNIHPNHVSSLDRLSYVGKQGMGALVYEPAIENNIPIDHQDFDVLADKILQFQEYDNDQYVDLLFTLNGSSAGARPKIMAKIGDKDWIIKFKSPHDPKDIGQLEYAYHLMAVAAGLEVPKAKLFPSAKIPGYFGVERFDRINGKRIHMHTLSGLLHVDHRLPTLDYETIMKATLLLTKDIRECEKQFRAAVFNVLSYNRDDHAKNFSFLMNHKGQWSVSPAYDLTFSPGLNGEHCTTLLGEGKNPNSTHLLKLAGVSEIKKSKAIHIIDEVKHAISQWETFAKEAGMAKTSSSKIQKVFCHLLKNI